MYWRDLPTLGFLPAFEAAGRLGSFKAAAAELHLTPSAVSQQIKLLEDALGVELFERRGRTAVLTQKGSAYLGEVRRALLQLSQASRGIRAACERKELRISVSPLAAHEFLVPRLPLLRARFPELDLRIETAMECVDFGVHGVDAAIRVGASPSPGLTLRVFGSLIAAPVCAPAMARAIRGPSDLHTAPLIELRGHPRMSLGMVMEARGLPVDSQQVWTFESLLDVLGAAEHGLGIAQGCFPILTHWVLAGRLAVPLAHRHKLADVALVHRSGDEARFPFAELAGWLQEQYAALPALPEGRVEPDWFAAGRPREPAAMDPSSHVS